MVRGHQHRRRRLAAGLDGVAFVYLAAARALVERRLPVTLEESLDNTLRFLDELAPEAVVVIPHCGHLNGGFSELRARGIWKRPHVYADSSAWPSRNPAALRTFLAAYGPEKLLYGSDYPFAMPGDCLQAILGLGLPPADEALVRAGYDYTAQLAYLD